MPSDYIEKNSIIPIRSSKREVQLGPQTKYSKTIKKAKEAFEDIKEIRQQKAELADPWEE